MALFVFALLFDDEGPTTPEGRPAVNAPRYDAPRPRPTHTVWPTTTTNAERRPPTRARCTLPRLHLLILSRRARDYQRLVASADLPDLVITGAADPADVAARAAEFDIALGEPSLLRHLLPTLTSLRWIQATWAGVEPLLDPALRRDYILTNARGVFGGLMSEYVFAYLLAHERRIFEKHASQVAGRWNATPPGTLRGKQIGLLGVGSIGGALARTAKHFGMRVRGYTRASEGCPDVDVYFHGDSRVAFATHPAYP